MPSIWGWCNEDFIYTSSMWILMRITSWCVHKINVSTWSITWGAHNFSMQAIVLLGCWFRFGGWRVGTICWPARCELLSLRTNSAHLFVWIHVDSVSFQCFQNQPGVVNNSTSNKSKIIKEKVSVRNEHFVQQHARLQLCRFWVDVQQKPTQ